MRSIFPHAVVIISGSCFVRRRFVFQRPFPQPNRSSQLKQTPTTISNPEKDWLLLALPIGTCYSEHATLMGCTVSESWRFASPTLRYNGIYMTKVDTTGRKALFGWCRLKRVGVFFPFDKVISSFTTPGERDKWKGLILVDCEHREKIDQQTEVWS